MPPRRGSWGAGGRGQGSWLSRGQDPALCQVDPIPASRLLCLFPAVLPQWLAKLWRKLRPDSGVIGEALEGAGSPHVPCGGQGEAASEIPKGQG